MEHLHGVQMCAFLIDWQVKNGHPTLNDGNLYMQIQNTQKKTETKYANELYCHSTVQLGKL